MSELTPEQQLQKAQTAKLLADAAKAEAEARKIAADAALAEAQAFKIRADAEASKIQVEQSELQAQERKLNVEDLRGRIEERKLKDMGRVDRFKDHGKALEQTRKAEETQQSKCTHRKGGNGLEGYIAGQGQKPEFAVMKHLFANGDMWIRCLRCGKTWKPPVRSQFYFGENGKPMAEYKGGKFDQSRYDTAFLEYKAACAFPTNNSTSSSALFGFNGEAQIENPDGTVTRINQGEWYREVTKDVSLR